MILSRYEIVPISVKSEKHATIHMREEHLAMSAETECCIDDER
jgi:hypothetical protein